MKRIIDKQGINYLFDVVRIHFEGGAEDAGRGNGTSVQVHICCGTWRLGCQGTVGKNRYAI